MDWTIAYDRVRAVAWIGVLGVSLVAAATSADAGGRTPRPHGDYSHHTQVSRTSNGHTRTDTWSNDKGTTMRQAEVVNDPTQQTRTRNVDWTGPQGQQAHRTDTTQRTDNGYTRDSTLTGSDGKVATRSAQVVNDPANQTRTRNVQWTGADGQQAERTDVTQRTDDGYTRDTTVTGPKGGTTTRDVVATRDAESGSWIKDVTVNHTPPTDNGG